MYSSGFPAILSPAFFKGKGQYGSHSISAAGKILLSLSLLGGGLGIASDTFEKTSSAPLGQNAQAQLDDSEHKLLRQLQKRVQALENAQKVNPELKKAEKACEELVNLIHDCNGHWLRTVGCVQRMRLYSRTRSLRNPDRAIQQANSAETNGISYLGIVPDSLNAQLSKAKALAQKALKTSRNDRDKERATETLDTVNELTDAVTALNHNKPRIRALVNEARVFLGKPPLEPERVEP